MAVASTALWAAAPRALPPRAAKAAPPMASSRTLERPSEIWRAAELEPASSGADSLSSSTLVEAITMPMPKQPNAQATATVQTGTPSISTEGATAIEAATSSMPVTISRSRCASMRGRDWTNEPSAQVAPPTARDSPAIVGDSPRWVTSISGTKDSAAMNDPAATPRSRTTEGSPRAARTVPVGRSPRTAGTSRAAPAAAGRRANQFSSCPAYWSSPAPAEIPRASRMRRRSYGSAAAAGSAGPEAVRLIAGRARASGITMRAGMPTKTQRHPRCSVTVPEASGPTTEGITQLAAKAARIAGRMRSG